MKRILIIHTGGTFGMVPKKQRPTLAPHEVQQNIVTYVPELARIADISFQMIFNMDSANLQPRHWQELAKLIYSNLPNYDGFVIIHGTDSMAYTAAALSFMLKNLPKPVVLTGSQRPLAEIRSDARSNLIGAVELATYSLPEVSIFFGTQLLRGNRAIKVSSTDYGAFVSPNFPPLAKVGVEVVLDEPPLSRTGQPDLQADICEDVVALRFFPGLNPTNLKILLNTDVRALVIEGLGMGNIAVEEQSFVPLVQSLSNSGKIVVVTSQSDYGWIDLTRYQNGILIAEAGAIGAGDMTATATIVKLMHLLGRYPGQPDRIRQELTIPLAGEISLQNHAERR